MIETVRNLAVLSRVKKNEIAELARRGTDATYRTGNGNRGDEAFIQRVIRISTDCVQNAAKNAHQHLVGAFEGEKLVGFVISTVHAEDSRELDWLFVDPDHHGRGIADALMSAGIDWLGRDRPMWLNVARSNGRAIAFYRRHGFEVDPSTKCAHEMPHWIMRRPATA